MQKEEDRDLTKAVDTAVDKAFRKYGGSYRKKGAGWKRVLVIILVFVMVFIAGGYVQKKRTEKSQEITAVDQHDVTLENRKIFGYKAADFSKPILGEAKQKKLLIVEEREASVNSTITDAGLLHSGIFSKSQLLTFHGKGIYTVDLSKIAENDISLNNFVITVRIPHPELHDVTYDPSKTEVGDTSRGWLAFGSIKLTAEQAKKVETEAVSRLKISLSSSDSMSEADRFATLTVTETLQDVVSTISPAYKVNVEFQTDSTSASESAQSTGLSTSSTSS